MNREIARRLVAAAYEQGWRDACDDHLQQRHDPEHPIGTYKRDLGTLLAGLDPSELLGLA